MSKTITDPEPVVERIRMVILTMRGSTLNGTIAAVLAEVLCEAFPWLRLEDAVDILANPLHVGKLITQELAEERARQIVTLMPAVAA